MRSPHRCPACRGRCYSATGESFVCVDCRSRWRFVVAVETGRVLVAGIRVA